MHKIIAAATCSTLVGITLLALCGCPARGPAAKTASGGGAVENIQWLTTMSSATQEAKSRHLPVVVDFVASWCTWCQKFTKESFPNPAVQALAGKFVWVRLDPEVDQATVSKYNVQSMPTILVLDASGKQIASHVGFMEGPKLAEFFTQALGKAGSSS